VLRDDPTKRLAVLEIGCGLRIPSIRKRAEELCAACPTGQAALVRINPDFSTQHTAFPPTVALARGAREALLEIDECISRRRTAQAKHA
jgi:hypothetical protein